MNMMYCWRNSSELLPTRKRMRIMYKDEANKMKKMVVNKLKASTSTPVTVALDGWTNTRHDKVINVTPICGGVAYYWQSTVMSTERCTAENQAPHIAEAIRSIISNAVIVVALATDNEAVNGSVYRMLTADFPFLVHVPCAAHTIQLCVKLILDLDIISTTIRGMAAIFSAFEKRKEYRLQLINLQKRSTHPLHLQKPNDTRWSSTFRAAKRLLELKDYIHMVMPQEQPL